MSTSVNLHGLRSGQVARGKRVAKMIARAVCTVNDNWNVDHVIRGLVLQLKAQRFNVRQLDSENGSDAIAAVFASMPTAHFRRLGSDNSNLPLGRYWKWIADRAERNVQQHHL